MATAIYMRVSTEKQEDDGVSLDVQKERLTAYCNGRGFNNIKEYLDVGSGRRTDNRVSFNQMMSDIKNGHISNVVIFKLDRLTRSIVDLNNLITNLNEYKCELHSSTENIDTTTPSGRMMMNLIGTFAQWESEMISERVSVSMQSQAEKGLWHAKVPYGYKLVNQTLELDEKEHGLLMEALNHVLDGNSFMQAENAILNKYNVKWGKDFLTKKVRSHSIVGDIFRNGKIVKENAFPPLISRSMRDKLLVILEERGRPREKYKKDDLFRRKVICPHCSSILGLQGNRSKINNEYMYRYECHTCIREKRPSFGTTETMIEEALIKRLKDGLINIEFDESDSAPSDKEKQISSLKSELKSLERQKKRLQRAWIEEIIDDDDLEIHQKEIDMKMNDVEKELKNLDVTIRPISKREVLELQSTLEENYSIMTKEEKMKFIQNHIKEIHVERERVEGFTKKFNLTVTDIVFF